MTGAEKIVKGYPLRRPCDILIHFDALRIVNDVNVSRGVIAKNLLVLAHLQEEATKFVSKPLSQPLGVSCKITRSKGIQ